MAHEERENLENLGRNSFLILDNEEEDGDWDIQDVFF
jgi:hypothetical protein